MKVDEYYIVPIELRQNELQDTCQRIGKLDWGESELPGTEEYPAYLVPSSQTGMAAPHRALHIAIADTCVCFIYHQYAHHTTQWKGATSIWTEAVLDEKERILNQVNKKITLPEISNAIAQLQIDMAERRSQTYGLSLYVLTLDDDIDQDNNADSIVDDISKLVKVPTREENRPPNLFSSTQPLAQNVDTSNTSAVYASYSAVVAAAWRDGEISAALAATEITEILIRLEISLQAAWNRVHQANVQLHSQLQLPNQPRNQTAATLEVKSDEFLNFGRTGQVTHRALTPSVSARERFIFDNLVMTSRIEDEIGALSRTIEALDKAFDRFNERRLESGQRWIAGLFALFAGTSAALGITSRFGWSSECDLWLWSVECYILVSVGIGLFATGLALWFTRPGRKVRWPTGAIRGP